MLALCAAPELDPRYGRLYAYLHDDVTRKLASPRLVADLLADDGVDSGGRARLLRAGRATARRGAIRLLPADAAMTLADRPVKVTDRLAAFLLGAADLADAAAGLALRRV